MIAFPPGPKTPLCIHREAVARPGGDSGPVIAYYRAGICWDVYWVAEDGREILSDRFDSLVDARRDAERAYAGTPSDGGRPRIA
jgi:hypothetical protein